MIARDRSSATSSARSTTPPATPATSGPGPSSAYRRAADSASVPTTRVKLAAFLVAGSIAGVAGGLHVGILHGLAQGTYSPEMSLEVFSTAVIGGIYRVSTDQGEDRVPGLANIPIIGYLFKNKSRREENEELLIFITPRVIKI